MLIVGLSGGIASGKSVVAHYFQEQGVSIIDSDQIAREIVIKGTPALDQIRQHFGPDILNEHGDLNRRRLRDIIFASHEERHWLETLTHPLILDMIRQRLETLQTPYCIIVIPLLIEVHLSDFVHRVLIVEASEKIQLKRVMERDHLTEEEAQKILAAQASSEQRRLHADDIIKNEGDLEELKKAVLKLHGLYLKISSIS